MANSIRDEKQDRLGDDDPSSDEPIAPQSQFAEFGINAGAVEEIHETFQVDPSAVDESWFEAFGEARQINGSEPDTPTSRRASLAMCLHRSSASSNDL